MNTIFCFGLLICASLALTTAFPAAELAESTLSLADAPVLETADDEALQPEESRYRRGWGGHHGGWGHGGHGGGWGHGGGYGHGGYGGGYGHGGYGGGYGHGGYGGGWGRRGGWGR